MGKDIKKLQDLIKTLEKLKEEEDNKKEEEVNEISNRIIDSETNENNDEIVDSNITNPIKERNNNTNDNKN